MKRILTNLPREFLRLRTQSQVAIPKIFRPLNQPTMLYDILIATISAILILLSILDYEITFSSERTHNNCKVNEIEFYKYSMLGLSLIGFASIFYKYYFKVKELKRKRKKLKLWYMCAAECLIFSIFSFPQAEKNIFISQISYNTSLSGKSLSDEICYKLSEVLYMASFFKAYFLIKFLIIILDRSREKVAHTYDPMGKQEKVSKRNVFIIFVIINITILFIFAEYLRVSERPYSDITKFNFDSNLTSMWCLATAMTSVGYGDIYPSTYLGRAICLFSAFLGTIIFGAIIYLFSSYVMITRREEKVRKTIEASRDIGRILQNALILNHYIITFGRRDERTKLQRKKLVHIIELTDVFKLTNSKRSKHKKITRKFEKSVALIESKIERLGFAIN